MRMRRPTSSPSESVLDEPHMHLASLQAAMVSVEAVSHELDRMHKRYAALERLQARLHGPTENFKVEGGEERMGGCWKRISAQFFYQVGDHHQHQRHLPSASSSSSS